MTDREEKIRQRAYGIWEKEGHPHGRAEDHWHRAAREVEGAAPPQPEMIQDIGTAPSLQPAEAAPAKKPAARWAKTAGSATTAPKRTKTKS